MSKKLSVEEINKLDPYQFMAELGKRIIHPGGRRSTNEVYSMANIQPEQKVLDIGCGVGTTAIEMVKKFGCYVIASDIDQKMTDRAIENDGLTFGADGNAGGKGGWIRIGGNASRPY